ncbi:MAG: DUF3052 domain-containing protein [Anaerolineae bacterium]|nr:DUF3052 domain-containing protein [Anaerolineae bacterium]
MAGYSKRTLAAKLGLKPGLTVYLVNPPENYGDTLGPLPETIRFVAPPEMAINIIQFFTKSRLELEALFPRLKVVMAIDGMLWISWPKKASKVETDLDEAIVREIGLANGLVDVKVCAVDEIWSGLKFVYRLKDRE